MARQVQVSSFRLFSRVGCEASRLDSSELILAGAHALGFGSEAPKLLETLRCSGLARLKKMDERLK